MTSEKHTPGRWLYSGGYPAFVAALDEESDPGNALRATVCELDSRLPEYQRKQSEIDANGWLIAAAPELLRLRGIAIDIEACLRSGVTVPEFMQRAFSDAITATAKAEGRE